MDHDELELLRTEADRRWRRRIVLVVIFLVVVTPVGAIAPFVLVPGPRRQPVPWGFVAFASGTAVAVLLVMLAVVLLVQRRRTGRWGPAPLAVAGTKASVRRRVFRAVRRGELPPSQPERTLAEELAQRTVAQRWVPWWAAASALVMAANAALQITEGQRTLGIAMTFSAVMFALVAVLSVRQRRGARRVLAASNPAHDDH